MNINLFKLSFELLESSDWAIFERLCSAFLSVEHGTLRTMANPSGDGGRDSELFCPSEKPIIVAQYSIQENWRDKIKKTSERLLKEFPSVHIFIYLSNQVIGAGADDLRVLLMNKNIYLDIRDRNWFLERATIGEARQVAAEEMIKRIALPYLQGEKIINRSSSPLSAEEERAALLYLGLQWQDDIKQKGLTKLSYDALVRAALRHTDSDHRLSRGNIHSIIKGYLPSRDESGLEKQVDDALERLSKRFIKYWNRNDEFCLSHEEHTRIIDKLAEQENEEKELSEEVGHHCESCLAEIDEASFTDLKDLRVRVPRIIERFLLKKGEIFASAVMTDTVRKIGFNDIDDIIIADINAHRPQTKIIQHYPTVVRTIIKMVLSESTPVTQRYLRKLSNSYTLFSFLRETPDVQSATRKIFSYGKVWLDTTVILPVIAEQFEEDVNQRRFTKLFITSSKAGIELRVTSGVLQEIISHMKRALACSKIPASSWQGRIPFLYYRYISSGGIPMEFESNLSIFRGDERPEEDIAGFLNDCLGIERESLAIEAETIESDLRIAVERLWTEAHKQRRQHVTPDYDESTTNQLIQHDVETYLGVISLRREETTTELGYKHWLLTLDKIAWQIRDKLKEEFPNKYIASPLLSLDFLANNLTFGPEREKLTASDEESLPLVLDAEIRESASEDIIGIADSVRKENEGLSDYTIKRKVRDACDKARRRRGCLGMIEVE